MEEGAAGKDSPGMMRASVQKREAENREAEPPRSEKR